MAGAVTLCLADEVILARRHDRVGRLVQSCRSVHVVWMSEEPLFPGRKVLLQIGPKQVPAQVTEIKHAINVNTMEHTAAKQLDLNEIAVCNVATDQAFPFAP